MRVSAAHIYSMPPLDLDFKQGIRNCESLQYNPALTRK